MLLCIQPCYTPTDFFYSHSSALIFFPSQRELSLTKEIHSNEKLSLEKRVASAGDQSEEATKKLGKELEETRKKLEDKEKTLKEVEEKLTKEERDKEEAVGEAAQLKEVLEAKEQVRASFGGLSLLGLPMDI